MDIEIREIELKDYSDVVLLWNEVLGNHNVNYENFSIIMDKMKNCGNYKTIVALSAGRVVGFITVMHALAVGLSNGYLHVQGLAVHKEYHHIGIGTKLLGHVENVAFEEGISSIILCSGFKRIGAHAFYEHCGYSKDSYCFDKCLNPDSGRI